VAFFGKTAFWNWDVKTKNVTSRYSWYAINESAVPDLGDCETEVEKKRQKKEGEGRDPGGFESDVVGKKTGRKRD
jgi:hypothetical protein